MPQRTWDDAALTAAVQKCTSWRAVATELNLHTTSVTKGLRRRADHLGLSYVHFTHQRTWSDDALRAAVQSSTTWAEAGRALGLSDNSGSAAEALKRHVRRLGLDTSHFGYNRSGEPAALTSPLPFTRMTSRSKGTSGLSTAARWFLDRGYLVSVPLEPAPYDLIVESDDGLKKVQVKTTRMKTKAGRYQVSLLRTIYDPDATPNSAGKYRQVPYARGVIDFFFVIADASAAYLIPFETAEGRARLVLDTKYVAFRVSPHM
jgi:hypothetical protein